MGTTGPTGLPLQILAFAFGAGVALTLDEFALILHLEDVYWSEQGRISVDAIVVATGAAALSLIVGPSLVGTGIGRTTVMEVAIAAILNLGFASPPSSKASYGPVSWASG